MNYIKKHMQLIVGMFIVILLVSGVSAYATYTYFATDVSYIRNGTVISVTDALNDLYDEKKNTVKKVYLGEYDSRYSKTIDVSKYEGYQDFTINNFVMDNVSLLVRNITSLDNRSGSVLSSYDNINGKLITKATGDAVAGWSYWINFKLYLLIGDIEEVNE